MSDSHDQNDQPFIANLIDNAPITDADTVRVCAHELLAAGRTGIFTECSDRGADALPDGPVQIGKLFRCRG
jgi:hypothetical protein